MPHHWETANVDWNWSPVTNEVFVDTGPWTWSIPLTFSALASPGGNWEPPVAPGPVTYDGPMDTLALNIAYWEPLLTVTFAALGWADPARGVDRWLRSGGATEGSAALEVLARWWGPNAAALPAWAARSESLSQFAARFAGLPGAIPTAQWRPDVDECDEQRWPALLTGGYDPLHLGHVVSQLLEHDQDQPVDPGTLLFDATERSAKATLMLDRYYGWYSILADVGRSLPARRDGRRWRVDVVVRPVGWLGQYRRSDVTGRWFTGTHRVHTLGWNGPA